MPNPRKAPKKGARADRRFLKDPRTKFRPEFVPIAKKMVRDGFSNFRIAEFFEVSMSTLSYWQVKFPRLARAMKEGEESLVKRTERSMWDRANGFSHDDVEIGYYRGKAIRTKVTKVHPPDVGAAKLMLGAHRPDKYRERIDLAGDPARPVQFIIKGLEQEAKGAPQNDRPASENERSAARV